MNKEQVREGTNYQIPGENEKRVPYRPGEVGYPPGAPRRTSPNIDDHQGRSPHQDSMAKDLRLDGGLRASNLPPEAYFQQFTTESVRGSVLNEANSIVNGARANVYGGPEDNFLRIAKLWGAHLNTEISTTDVAILLALVKVARLKNSPDHRDSWVDIAGYAACGAECGLK